MFGLINWNTVPMTFNDSWTYLEMLGKCVTQVQINAKNIADNRTMIEDHETRLVNLEATVIPAILSRLDTIEDTMVTEAELAETLEDYATRAWVSGNFVSSAVLEDYATLAFVTENYVTNTTLESYYTKTECDNRFALASTVNAMANDLNLQISQIRQIAREKGSAVYHAVDLQAATISDNVMTLDFSDFDFDAALVNVTYTVQNLNDTYTKDFSLHVNTGATATDFTMYSVSYGGGVTVQESNGELTVTVAKPAGTEIITFVRASVVLYTKYDEPSAAEKARYYRTADLDGDGEISITDAQNILRFAGDVLAELYTNDLAGFIEFCNDNNIVPADSQYVYPDANQDGTVNVLDSQLVQIFYTQCLAELRENTPDGFYDYLINE